MTLEEKAAIKARVYAEAKAKYKRAGARYAGNKTLTNHERYLHAKSDYQKKGQALAAINREVRGRV